MTYKVVAESPPVCDCEDCRAGRHLYSLFRWRDGEWKIVGVSLQSYASADDTAALQKSAEALERHWPQ